MSPGMCIHLKFTAAKILSRRKTFLSRDVCQNHVTWHSESHFSLEPTCNNQVTLLEMYFDKQRERSIVCVCLMITQGTIVFKCFPWHPLQWASGAAVLSLTSASDYYRTELPALWHQWTDSSSHIPNKQAGDDLLRFANRLQMRQQQTLSWWLGVTISTGTVYRWTTWIDQTFVLIMMHAVAVFL